VKGLLDRTALLKLLEAVKPEKEQRGWEEQLRRVSLQAALLHLAEIDHEHEYQLCRSVARHLLGEVPDPGQAELPE